MDLEQSQENIEFKCTLPSTQIKIAPTTQRYYVPPEIIENIVYFLLIGMNKDDGDSLHINCDKDKSDNEYTLLNLFIVFPYLLKQIKSGFCTNNIPVYIYNFVYMETEMDSVFDKYSSVY